jgi:hypothetical protein
MIRFLPYDASFVAAVRAGGPDAYGRPAERAVSDGAGTSCRSCLRDVPEGAGALVLAARPFPEPQPCAETGPILLCAEPHEPWAGEGVPPTPRTAPDHRLKGCSAAHRIVHGTGRMVQSESVADHAAEVFGRPENAYIDARAARRSCFQTRIVHAA